MDYQQALEYLQSLNTFGIKLGLDRIRELLIRLNNPQDNLRIIHVGGTNGKGSTSAIISSLLQAGGCRVGQFSSPHLLAYTERYKINDAEMTQGELIALLTEIQPVLAAMTAAGFEHPTEFEVSTALALLYFARAKVDFVVLEVGLGGAIDSTNVVTPLISVITNVAMDHMEYLGNTLLEIARVKSGIIKPGVPIVTAVSDQDALKVVQETANQLNAPLIHVGQNVKWQIESNSSAGVVFDWEFEKQKLNRLHLPLLGRHQAVNASTALAVLSLLQQADYLALTEEQIRIGLASTRWPGRMEILQRQPWVIVDGAHNLAGAQALSAAIEEIFHKQKVILVIGMLADKERFKVARELAKIAKAVVITKPNSPRAGEWQELAEEFVRYIPVIAKTDNIAEAVERGLAVAAPEDIVCITGSLYMVGEAKKKWL